MNNLSLFLSDILLIKLYMHKHIYSKIFFQDPYKIESTRAATGQDADPFAPDLLFLLDFLLFLQ